MTSAEKALLDAACEHWISGRFNHLIEAVRKEREEKESTHPLPIECANCGYFDYLHEGMGCYCPSSGDQNGDTFGKTFQAKMM